MISFTVGNVTSLDVWEKMQSTTVRVSDCLLWAFMFLSELGSGVVSSSRKLINEKVGEDEFIMMSLELSKASMSLHLVSDSGGLLVMVTMLEVSLQQALHG